MNIKGHAKILALLRGPPPPIPQGTCEHRYRTRIRCCIGSVNPVDYGRYSVYVSIICKEFIHAYVLITYRKCYVCQQTVWLDPQPLTEDERHQLQRIIHAVTSPDQPRQAIAPTGVRHASEAPASGIRQVTVPTQEQHAPSGPASKARKYD